MAGRSPRTRPFRPARRVVALAGTSGSGKTTLAEHLLRWLVRRGLRAGYVKHDAHRFEMDHPGKDTWRAAQAGASVVTITSSVLWAWLERRDPPGVEALVRRALAAADVCVVEGHHGSRYDKVAVCRRGHPLRLPTPARTLIATWGDPPPRGALPDPPPPHFGTARVGALARFLFLPPGPRGARSGP